MRGHRCWEFVGFVEESERVYWASCCAGLVKSSEIEHVPSKTRTAEGKSFTRLAAFRAEMMTDGDGTRS
jgi:hypothetical protein